MEFSKHELSIMKYALTIFSSQIQALTVLGIRTAESIHASKMALEVLKKIEAEQTVMEAESYRGEDE